MVRESASLSSNSILDFFVISTLVQGLPPTNTKDKKQNSLSASQSTMPRRRASKGQTKSSRGKGPSSVERWDRREEIPLDEVDQCELL